MNCNLCGNDGFKPIIRFNDSKISVVRCKKCGLITLSPISLEHTINDDFEHLSRTDFQQYLKQRRTPQFRRDLGIIKKYIPSGKILDVGSNYGHFLNIAREEGFVTLGIEPSASAIEYCKKEYPSVEVQNTIFEQADVPDNSVDAVTFWSVLEHTIDPSNNIRLASQKLRTGGVLAVRVPNCDGLLTAFIWKLHKFTCGKIDGPSKSLYQMQYQYKHFYHFNPRTLSAMFEKNGLKVLEYYTENTLNPKLLKERLKGSGEKKDVEYLRNPLVRFAVFTALKLADFFKKQDNLVIFAEKK